MNYDSYIKDETLLWTMTSNGYKYLTYNLYLSLQKVNPKIKLMIVCVDKESQIFFRTMNISSIFYKSTKPVPPGTQPSQFGSDTFMNYNRMKLEIMEDLRLKTDVNYIIYLDGDIVVFKDFIPYIKEQFTLLNTTFLFQCDDLYGSPNKTQCCTGFFAFKRTHLEKSPFVLYDKGLWLTIREDQPWVNKHIRMYNIPFEFLDRSLFPNGVYVNEGRWKLGDPYILHFNHMVGNAKISMMKRLGLWYHMY
uniref:Nucleotide-diphospho-sugar transferase domain-containing protein n=1 Tax=viral metagenome TaxID=1070528 RepID=A0A6C0IEG5_9ZZZZ